MKQERKYELLDSFPAVPDEIRQKMLAGKGAMNFVVFLTHGRELFVRCFHRYSRGKELIERQRYVFAKDGFVRYGFDYNCWHIRRDFREPIFCAKSYGYNFDNSYNILNFEAISKSDMRYSQLSKKEKFPISYLRLYCRHPNLEYLMKAKYYCVLSTKIHSYCGGEYELVFDEAININWKSNNLLRMLKLSRTEFKAIKGLEMYYPKYINMRDRFPNYQPEDLINLAKTYGYEVGTLERHIEMTGLTAKRLARYLDGNNIRPYDYTDYLEQCQTLRYNLADTAISLPHNFEASHTRCSQIIKYEQDKKAEEMLQQLKAERIALEYSYGGLQIVQPQTGKSIIDEGKALNHCVGGYTKRHSIGQTNIMFIREKTEPDKPFYTMEIDNNYKIIQVRGFRNCNPTEAVKELINNYKSVLERLKHERIKHTA